jgi:N-acetylmuramoyl-L-alanine amidase CwlA
MQINQKLLPVGHPNRPGRKIESYKGLIIHYTANDNPTATDTSNVIYMSRGFKLIKGKFYEADGKTPFRYGSAHTFCDMDSITRCIPYNEVAWSCGDRWFQRTNGYDGQTKVARDYFKYRQNYNSVSIEICNNDVIKNSEEDWNKAVQNAIIEAAYIMKTYKIPIEHVFRHYDVTGKPCPKPLLPELKWKQFLDDLDRVLHS